MAGNGPLKNQLCLQVDAWSDNLPGDWCSIPRLACYCALSCLLSNWTHKVLLIHWKLGLNPNWQFDCSSLWDKFTNDYWQPTVNCSMVNVDLVTWPGACFIKCCGFERFFKFQKHPIVKMFLFLFYSHLNLKPFQQNVISSQSILLGLAWWNKRYNLNDIDDLP